MIPKYTGEWNRGNFWRGDTLLGFTMCITDKDTSVPVVPVGVRAHIADSFGRKIASLDSTIEEDGTVTFGAIDGEVTASWRIGEYAFDVEYTLDDSRVRTYLTGKFTILEDKTKCR